MFQGAIQPGLCSVTFRALPPEGVVALAADAGLAAIEWGGDVHVPVGDVEAARCVRALTEAAGLAPASYGSYWRGGPGDAVVATAAALGAGNVRVWAGRAGSALVDQAGRDVLAAELRSLAALAALRGLTVSLEHHPDTLTDDLAATLGLLAAAASPNLFTYWQPRPGLPLADALTEIAALSPALSHLHVFQWDAVKRRYPLADGAAVWPACLAAVMPGRWAGPRYAMLEFVTGDDPAAFAADAATLRSWLSP